MDSRIIWMPPSKVSVNASSFDQQRLAKLNPKTDGKSRPDALCEIRIVRRDLTCNGAPQQRQLPGRRHWGYLCVRTAIEFKTGRIQDFLEGSPRMDALQPEAALVLLPRKQCLAREQGLRPAAALHFRRTPAGRGNEIHLRHQYALRMLLAEENRPAGGEIHERRTEGAGKALVLG